MKPVRVGIAGLGVVGRGTIEVLQRNTADISRRIGRTIDIVHVASRNGAPDLAAKGMKVSTDVMLLATDPDIDILVEVMGGTDTALELLLAAIDNGKHIVTANKALIAQHGNAIFKAARAKGVDVTFEAAVAGGVPILKVLSESLAANRINWIAGIINGTGNYILTEMEQGQRQFGDVLQEAQQLGYAEADPTFDVEGIDAAHKLMILASIGFGIPLQFSNVYMEGITRITPEDVESASRFGYRIKHLGIAKDTGAGIELRVHPTLVPKTALLANVNGVMNAVMVDGNAVGSTLYYGAGAGGLPTGSAVAGNIIELGRELTLEQNERVPYLGFPLDGLSTMPALSIEDVECPVYLRLHVHDRPGVLADITRILSDNGTSIEALEQKEANKDGIVSIVMMLHRVREGAVNAALGKISALPAVYGDIMRIRVEMLDQ